MKDVIDERDKKAQISRSIVKSWNVNYIAQPPVDMERAMMPERADEGAALSGTEKQMEPKEANHEDYYNATTGSYSGAYGKEEVQDEKLKERIDKILQEKTEALRSLVEQGGQREEGQ